MAVIIPPKCTMLFLTDALVLLYRFGRDRGRGFGTIVGLLVGRGGGDSSPGFAGGKQDR